MMQSNCAMCEHYVNGTGTCKAFPNGIPNKFFMQTESHDKVVKGQKGDFVFMVRLPDSLREKK
jgi:hypothetical protein